MEKKKAKLVLQSPNNKIDENIIIEQQEDMYYFSLSDNSKNRFSTKDATLIRETKDMFLELDFKEKSPSKMYLKKERLEYILTLKVKKIKITSSYIEINYKLNQEEYTFKIVLENKKRKG